MMKTLRRAPPRNRGEIHPSISFLWRARYRVEDERNFIYDMSLRDEIYELAIFTSTEDLMNTSLAMMIIKFSVLALLLLPVPPMFALEKIPLRWGWLMQREIIPFSASEIFTQILEKTQKFDPRHKFPRILNNFISDRRYKLINNVRAERREAIQFQFCMPHV